MEDLFDPDVWNTGCWPRTLKKRKCNPSTGVTLLSSKYYRGILIYVVQGFHLQRKHGGLGYGHRIVYN